MATPEEALEQVSKYGGLKAVVFIAQGKEGEARISFWVEERVCCREEWDWLLEASLCVPVVIGGGEDGVGHA